MIIETDGVDAIEGDLNSLVETCHLNTVALRLFLFGGDKCSEI
jgi:hypothetical protein